MNQFYSLLLLFGVIVSCSEQKTKAGIKTYYPLEICSEYNEMSDYFDVELIELQHDAPENILNDIEKISVIDSGFIVNDYKKVLRYTKDGEFVCKYGDVGKAENEYSEVHDLAVSMDNKRVYILTTRGVVAYDIETGEYIRRYKNNDFYMGIAIGKDDCFYFFKTYGSVENDGEKALPYILRYDQNGNKLSEHLFWKNIVFGRNSIMPTYNNRYFVKPQGEDKICYEICGDSIAPVAKFMIDFGEKHTPFRYGVDKMSFDEHISSDYYKNIGTPVDNQDYVTFIVEGPKGVPYRFVINKNSDTGIYFTESRVSFKSSDKNSFYVSLPLEYDNSPFDRELKNKLGDLSEEKSYIAKITFKFIVVQEK